MACPPPSTACLQVVLYRLSQEAYAQFLQMPDLKGNANAAGLYMMRCVGNRRVHDEVRRMMSFLMRGMSCEACQGYV